MDVRLAEKEGFAGLFLRLRAEGLADKSLLTALEQTPRTLFLSAAYSDCAYQDRLVPIDCGGFAESADLVARLIVALGIEPGHRVLDLGTGSGFLAAVAARLSERVVTVDRFKTLIQLAQQRSICAWCTQNTGSLAAVGTLPMLVVVPTMTCTAPCGLLSSVRLNPICPR